MGECGVRQREVGERGVHDVGAEMQVDPWCGIRQFQQGLRDTERAQDLQGPRVQDERTRGPERLGAPLDDPDLRSVVMGLEGEAEAGRTGPDDQELHGHVETAVCHQAVSSGSAFPAGRELAIMSSRCSPGTTMYRMEPGTLTSASTRQRERA